MAKYCVDIVLCIDATGSMGPIIEEAKQRALAFHDDLFAAMSEKDKKIDVLRVKIITFRDLFVDGDAALTQSQFFTLPDEREKHESFVKSISAFGGGDEPESGLEALASAIKADWTTDGDKRRHVICLWTDTSSHPLEKEGKLSSYPADMPANFSDLTDWWEQKMDRFSKRLLIYAPDAYAWSDISNVWNNALHYVSQAGTGLEEIDYKTIVTAIAESVGGQ